MRRVKFNWIGMICIRLLLEETLASQMMISSPTSILLTGKRSMIRSVIFCYNESNIWIKESNKPSANCSNSLVEPFQSMSFSSGDDFRASKAAPSLPTPVIFSQQSFSANTMTPHSTQPVQNQMYSSPAQRNPFLDPQTTSLTTQKQTLSSQESQHFHPQNVFASPHVQQTLMYHNQSSSPGTSSADRYSALADLDASVKAEAMNARRAKLQKQVSVGQQIFGAAPSSANPFLNPKRQSSVKYSMPNQPIAPSCMFSSNPFSSGDPTNPFLWFRISLFVCMNMYICWKFVHKLYHPVHNSGFIYFWLHPAQTYFSQE